MDYLDGTFVLDGHPVFIHSQLVALHRGLTTTFEFDGDFKYFVLHRDPQGPTRDDYEPAKLRVVPGATRLVNGVLGVFDD